MSTPVSLLALNENHYSSFNIKVPVHPITSLAASKSYGMKIILQCMYCNYCSLFKEGSTKWSRTKKIFGPVKHAIY